VTPAVSPRVSRKGKERSGSALYNLSAPHARKGREKKKGQAGRWLPPLGSVGSKKKKKGRGVNATSRAQSLLSPFLMEGEEGKRRDPAAEHCI